MTTELNRHHYQQRFRDFQARFWVALTLIACIGGAHYLIRFLQEMLG